MAGSKRVNLPKLPFSLLYQDTLFNKLSLDNKHFLKRLDESQLHRKIKIYNFRLKISC